MFRVQLWLTSKSSSCSSRDWVWSPKCQIRKQFNVHFNLYLCWTAFEFGSSDSVSDCKFNHWNPNPNLGLSTRTEHELQTYKLRFDATLYIWRPWSIFQFFLLFLNFIWDFKFLSIKKDVSHNSTIKEVKQKKRLHFTIIHFFGKSKIHRTFTVSPPLFCPTLQYAMFSKNLYAVYVFS